MIEGTATNTADRNAQLLREGYEAFSKGDLEKVAGMFAPECTWHSPRLGLLSGDHKGWPAIAQFFGRTMELTQGTFRIEVRDVLANDRGCAVVVRSGGQREGKQLDDQQVHLYRVEDGKVAEVWQYPGDGLAVNDFWS